jgi:cell division protein FtsL
LPGKLKWGLFLVLGLGFLVITWWYPQYQEIQEMNNRVADLEWKKLQMKATNQDLQDEITWLGTDAAIERLAREELGLVKPGERVLIDLQSTGN